jgi:hypothetical protein
MPALPIKDMGPCEVIWGYGESGEIELGPFLGATVYKGETHTADILEERHGDAAVDAVMIGTVASLELRMTRSTLEQLSEVLNAGGVQGTPPEEYLIMRNQMSCEMYDLAKAVVIKPICGDEDGVPEVSTDPSEWVHIFKCFPVAGWELTWDKSTQRVFPVTFKVFVSQESGFEGQFGTLGMVTPV